MTFTKAEAQSQVGKHIHTKVAWAGVPTDSTGRGVGIDDIGKKKMGGRLYEDWDVIGEWDSTARHVHDWFTKDEYEQYLEEV